MPDVNLKEAAKRIARGEGTREDEAVVAAITNDAEPLARMLREWREWSVRMAEQIADAFAPRMGTPFSEIKAEWQVEGGDDDVRTWPTYAAALNDAQRRIEYPAAEIITVRERGLNRTGKVLYEDVVWEWEIDEGVTVDIMQDESSPDVRGRSGDGEPGIEHWDRYQHGLTGEMVDALRYDGQTWLPQDIVDRWLSDRQQLLNERARETERLRDALQRVDAHVRELERLHDEVLHATGMARKRGWNAA